MADEDMKHEAPPGESGSKDTAGILADAVEQFNCPACGATIDVKGATPFSEITCHACEAQTTVPQKLGNFLLMRMIGMGGMGGVYFARDEQLGRDVAIKVMLQSLGDDPQFIETFRHEAQAVAKLNHANIAQIYSFGQEKGQPYIVMELVSGERVDALMEKHSGLSSREAIRIALEIAQGLSAADEAGLVHGDIKPENILLDKKRNAKLVDFGLATVAHQNATEGIWGTPYYISPEKIRRQKLDARSDIYSLGATLYHMLTRQPPFEGETPVEVVKARLEKPPPDPRDVDPELPPIVSEIILRMLAVERTERYPNYRSLISDLRKALQTYDANASKTPTLPSGKSIRIKKRGSPSKVTTGSNSDAAAPSASDKKLVFHKSGNATKAGTGRIKLSGTKSLVPELSDEERALRREKQRKRKIATIITVFSILGSLAIIGSGIGYFIHYQNRVAYQRQQAELHATQRTVENLVTEIAANRRRVERISTELQPVLEQVRDTAERMNIPLKTAAAAVNDNNDAEQENEEAENQEDGEDAKEPEETEAAVVEEQPTEVRREGPEVTLAQDFITKHEEITVLHRRVVQIEKDAQESQTRLLNTTNLATARNILSEVQQMNREASDIVVDAQRHVQELLRAGRRLAELRQRFDDDERRREEAERERQRREEQRAAEERERQQQQVITNQELRQLRSFEQDLRGRLDQNAFTDAYNQMQTYANNFTTETSIQAYRNSLERFRYLSLMKENIIAGIQAAPFPWGYGSGASARDITGASSRGLQVQGARDPIPWSNAQPQQMLRLIDRYIESRDLSVRQRMEIAFGGALYADLFGEAARDRARSYKRRAMDLGLRRETFENVLESRWDAEGGSNANANAPDFVTQD